MRSDLVPSEPSYSESELTTTEVADLLGIAPGTARSWTLVERPGQPTPPRGRLHKFVGHYALDNPRLGIRIPARQVRDYLTSLGDTRRLEHLDAILLATHQGATARGVGNVFKRRGTD